MRSVSTSTRTHARSVSTSTRTHARFGPADRRGDGLPYTGQPRRRTRGHGRRVAADRPRRPGSIRRAAGNVLGTQHSGPPPTPRPTARGAATPGARVLVAEPVQDAWSATEPARSPSEPPGPGRAGAGRRGSRRRCGRRGGGSTRRCDCRPRRRSAAVGSRLEPVVCGRRANTRAPHGSSGGRRRTRTCAVCGELGILASAEPSSRAARVRLPTLIGRRTRRFIHKGYILLFDPPSGARRGKL
jgi:hypothetical protein